MIQSVAELPMADKSSLRFVGLALAVLVVATILVAALVVHRTMTGDLNRDFPFSKVS